MSEDTMAQTMPATDDTAAQKSVADMQHNETMESESPVEATETPAAEAPAAE